jgi:CheY-like chemotaxis protein
MSIVLGKLGHSVQVTSGPEEALRVFGASTEHPFDLLITDLVMPTMTGTELARKILEQAPSTKVIYTSGLSAARAAELGVDPQHDCYLQKPVTLAGMRETITAVLAK